MTELLATIGLTSIVVAVVAFVVGRIVTRRAFNVGYRAGYDKMFQEHEAYRARNRDILDGLQKASRLPTAAPLADFPRPHSVQPPFTIEQTLDLLDTMEPAAPGDSWRCSCGLRFDDQPNAYSHVIDNDGHRLTRYRAGSA